jgi:hypothetical protein
MNWKYECIVREINARFQLRHAILACNFVIVLLGSLQIV